MYSIVLQPPPIDLLESDERWRALDLRFPGRSGNMGKRCKWRPDIDMIRI